jgi:predicted permease
VHDLRYGLRALLAAPGFSALAVISLAVGIGASTAVFSVTDAFLLRSLHVPHPEELVTLEQQLNDGTRRYNFSASDRDRFEALVEAGIFTAVSGTTWTDGFEMGGPAGPGEQLRVSAVTGQYFSLLQLAASAGRLITEDDDRAGRSVAAISDSVWKKRFGRAPDAVGRTMDINGTPYTIVGVVAAGFAGDWVGWPTDVWVPSAMLGALTHAANPAQARVRMQYKLLARLRSGVSAARAEAAAAAVYRQMQADPPQFSGVADEGRLDLVDAGSGYSPQRPAFVRSLAILLVSVGAVLLMACANVANLLLVRAASRQREVALRTAIGANRWRIVRMLLLESLIIGAAGALLGLLLAIWGADLLLAIVRSGPAGSVTVMSPTPNLSIAPDLRVFGFTMVLAFLASAVAGVVPALRGSSPSLNAALGRRGTAEAGAAGRIGPRRLLIVAQIAVSLVLLIGAGLFVRTLTNLRSQDLGLDRDRVLLVWASPGHTGRSAARLLSLWEDVQRRTSTIPGVVSSGVSVEGVFGGTPPGGPLIRSADTGRETRVEGTMTVGPRFFETVGQRLLSGRDFSPADTGATTRVAVVNERLARALFGTANPVGRQFHFAGTQTPPVEIVGVVGDARHYSPRDVPSTVYYPPAQNLRRLSRSMCVVVRTANPAGVAARIRQELRDADPRLAVLRIGSVAEQLDSVLVQERLMTGLSLFFAGLAALLACSGLYGVVAFTTARRANEVGIRIALGASRANVLSLVLRDTALTVLAGLALGVPAAFAASRSVADQLFGVSLFDPLVCTVAMSLMIVLAGISAGIPARRAARMDPSRAMRLE